MRTFGSYLAEVFASGLAVLLMLGGAAESLNVKGACLEVADTVGSVGVTVAGYSLPGRAAPGGKPESLSPSPSSSPSAL